MNERQFPGPGGGNLIFIPTRLPRLTSTTEMG